MDQQVSNAALNTRSDDEVDLEFEENRMDPDHLGSDPSVMVGGVIIGIVAWISFCAGMVSVLVWLAL